MRKLNYFNFFWILGGLLCGQYHLYASPDEKLPCEILVERDKCWKDYQIDVDFLNASTRSSQLKGKINTISKLTDKEKEKPNQVLIKGKCDKNVIMSFFASFSPAFWEEDEGKRYRAKRNWRSPMKLDSNVSAWRVEVCFPRDFHYVPAPPDDLSDCGCSTVKPLNEKDDRDN